METFFATCPRGLEDELKEEFHALGGKDVRATPGGVACQGPFTLCYRLNQFGHGNRIAKRYRSSS